MCGGRYILLRGCFAVSLNSRASIAVWAPADSSNRAEGMVSRRRLGAP